MGAIYRDELRQPKRSADDGNSENRFLGQNGDAARNGANNRGRISVAGVVRGEKTGSRGNILQPFDAHAHAGGAADQENGASARAIERINLAGDGHIKQKGQAHHDGDDRQGKSHECAANHRGAAARGD